MTRTSWHVRCILYGLRGESELEQCGALLRGISVLYGDGFDFTVTSLDDANSLHHVAKSLSLPTDDVAHCPFVRMVCTHARSVDELSAIGMDQIASALRAVVERQLHGSDVVLGRPLAQAEQNQGNNHKPIKIFVSGDRSQVGKSTCCLGLVGSLLKLGYRPDEIGYIKPATQCEQPQLIAKFCRQKGIDYCDIGPIVFYSGFTREYLKGNTETSQELLAKAHAKVDTIGRGKKIVVVDGVGYPAVGSICGVSNASVAHAVQSPVVLVGKRGVGDAVDSYNLNACFFESQGVHVLGAIFNRLPLDGYYSLENCRDSVLQYFLQFQPNKRVYGFIPELPEPSNAVNDSMVVDDACCEAEQDTGGEHMTRQEFQRASQVIALFSQSVNVAQLVEDARVAQSTSFSSGPPFGEPMLAPVNKRSLPSSETTESVPQKKSRLEIQEAAKASGAASG